MIEFIWLFDGICFFWGFRFELENTGPASLWQAPVVTHAQLPPQLPPMIPHMPAPPCAPTGYMPAHFMSLGINLVDILQGVIFPRNIQGVLYHFVFGRDRMISMDIWNIAMLAVSSQIVIWYDWQFSLWQGHDEFTSWFMIHNASRKQFD